MRPTRKKKIHATTSPVTAAVARHTGAKLRRFFSTVAVNFRRHEEQTTRSSCSVTHSRQ
jgi:predicted secreted Zn-dependent protease